MNKPAALLAILAIVSTLTACSGGATGVMPAPAGLAPAGAISGDKPVRHLQRIKLHLRIPRRHAGHSGHYIGSGTQSIKITLTKVNGNPPPTGLTTTAIDSVSAGSCNSGCTVLGPKVPVGSDTIAISTYDATNAGGNELSTATQVFAISPGVANNLSVTLLGIVAQFAVTPPTGTAGTSQASAAVTLTPEDADGNAITGTYSNPVTVTDGESDGLGATSLQLNGGSGASSVQVNNATQAGQVTLAYNGQAIVSPSLTVTASGATGYSGSFAVTNSNPSSTCSDGGASICNSGPEVDLYNTSGTGSTASLTSTQTGWTQSTWNSNVAESDNCSSIATIAQTKTTGQNSNNGTVYSVTALNTDSSSASCSVTLTGGAGKTESVTVTFTASSIGVNARHHRQRPH